MKEKSYRQCPFCKESIDPLATKCKHCRSLLLPTAPAHGGICPFCREEIDAEAVKCKHCDSQVMVLVDAGLFSLASSGMSGTAFAMIGPGGQGDAPDDGKVAPKRCFKILVPDCRIELGDPVPSSDGAGFFPDRIVCDGWKWIEICLPDIF